jgi:hypothetical protein
MNPACEIFLGDLVWMGHQRMLGLEDGDWRVGIRDSIVRMTIVEGIRREAVELIPISLILHDKRAAFCDIVKKPACILAQLISDQIGIRADYHGIKIRQVQRGYLFIVKDVNAQAEVAQSIEESFRRAPHISIPVAGGKLGRDHVDVHMRSSCEKGFANTDRRIGRPG